MQSYFNRIVLICLLIFSLILGPFYSFANTTDTTPPTLTVNPSSGNIQPEATITITASDPSGIHHIGYVWDNGTSTTSVYSSTATIKAPSTTGNHTLYVYAKDNSSNYNNTGWKSYTYTVTGSNNTTDTTPPTLTVNPSSGNIQPEATITITASDPSGIHHIGYVWDNGTSTTPVYSSTATIKAPSTTGNHTLYVYAKDNSSNYNNTGWKSYTYTVSGTNNTTDTTPPTLTVNPSSGNIQPEATITITASDPSGIHHIGYVWDNSTSTTPVYSNTATIKAPSTAGNHTLYVYAKDNSSNYNNTGWKSYTYTVTGSNNTTDTTPPTLTVNPSSGNIQPEATITITASDPSGIHHIGYVWDNGTSTTPVYSSTATIKAPSTAGSHTLYVYAKDSSPNYNNTGWKSYTYTVTGSNNTTDTTPPTLTVNPSSGNIQPEATITITASDPSGIHHIGYVWDNGTSTTPVYSSTATIKAPSTAGTHTLYVYAKDNSSNYNSTGWKSYTYTVTGSNNTTDTTPPTLTVNPSSGNIQPEATITITASDPSGIHHIGYVWDNGTTTTAVYSSTATVKAPSTAGTHTLYVYAKDNSSNYNNTGWKSYTYTVTGSNNTTDTTPPTLTVNPSSGNIQPEATITITASDPSGIHHIGYVWDNGTSTTPVYSNTATIKAPSTAGTHTLYVYAKDNSSNYNNTGWKSYTYTVTGSNNTTDTTPPTLTVNPSSGNIQPEATITITASDPSGIHHIGYVWDNGTSTTPVYSNTATIKAPSTAGTHTLYVYAKDNSSNYNNTGWKSYTYTVITNSDTTPPTITVTPSSGTIAPGSTITISASDASGIYLIGYVWDSGNPIQEVRSNLIDITAPTTTGPHTLYVYAKDNSPNQNYTGYKSFTYTVGGIVVYPGTEYPASGGIGTINPAIKTLKVELRNSSNKIKYAINEEILYYIDYFNGTGLEINSAEITFNVPDGFTIVNTYNGTIQNRIVTWQLQNIKPLQSGRLPVKVKFMDSNISERIVVLEASIKRDGIIQETSMLRNMIYKPGTKGYHEKYVGGYSDGRFGPNKGVTRAELATILARIFNIRVENINNSMNPYKDLSKKHWAYGNIIACTKEGLFGGYPDGSFKPDKVVTRAEFSAILARKLNINGIEPIWIHADDIKNHWAKNDIEQLIRLNIIEGYSDGTIKPDKEISRAEVVTLINRFLFRGPLNTSKSSFWDVSPNHWAIGHIEEAGTNHSYSRDDKGDEN